MDDGYIMLSRRFFASKKWQAARAFSECEAWIDLIQSARFEASPTASRIGCYEVTWNRGQYPASNRFLAKKWGRSEQWVKTTLGKWKREQMITTDNSQGVNVITLINYDKYNGDSTSCNPPLNPPSNPLNDMEIKELRRLLTHLSTHLTTHPVEKQPTSNPNKKKDNNIITTTPPTSARACEGDTSLPVYGKFLKSTLKSQTWLETLAMNYRMGTERLKELLHEFVTDNECRGFDDTGKTLRDFKSHFNNWLLVRLRVENEQKRKGNGDRQGNGAAATYEQRRDEAAEQVMRRLRQDDAQTLR